MNTFENETYRNKCNRNRTQKQFDSVLFHHQNRAALMFSPRAAPCVHVPHDEGDPLDPEQVTQPAGFAPHRRRQSVVRGRLSRERKH